jgi:hypothetical protein
LNTGARLGRDRSFPLRRRAAAQINPCHRDIPTSGPGVHHLQRGWIGVGGESGRHIVGVRPDNLDLHDVAAQRQETLLVLEQGHRFGGEPARQVGALARNGANLDRILCNVRVVEQAERKLVPQHAARGWSRSDSDTFRYARPAPTRPVAEDGRLDIHASRQCGTPASSGFRTRAGAFQRIRQRRVRTPSPEAHHARNICVKIACDAEIGTPSNSE